MGLIDTIFFDWDGTLIDTAQQAYEAFRKTLLDLGFPLDLDTYERIYSPNWYLMYEALKLPGERWKEADDLWLHHYAYAKATLLPGVKAVLSKMETRGYTVGLVTSGTRARVRREVKALGLTNAFRIIVCSEDVVNKKPHPEGLKKAMRELGKPPECCCYVGDCPDDIEMGKFAHVLTVGISSRYPASRQLLASNPDLLFESLDEFLAHLEEGKSLWAGISGCVRE